MATPNRHCEALQTPKQSTNNRNLDCHDLTLSSLAMTSGDSTNLTQDTRIAGRVEYTDSSLRGVANAEAIYESKKMDCHDSAIAESRKTRRSQSFFSNDKNDKI